MVVVHLLDVFLYLIWWISLLIMAELWPCQETPEDTVRKLEEAVSKVVLDDMIDVLLAEMLSCAIL